MVLILYGNKYSKVSSLDEKAMWSKKAGGSNRKQAAKRLAQQRKMNCREVAALPLV